ncbi:zeta toxin family protein [Streptomyces sp. NPDC088560]|uniref:zeta toxin family protein n=1 Tax=Streptomyces sp. NPDC088560 TaxID=3365868 RepID=UPI003814455B
MPDSRYPRPQTPYYNNSSSAQNAASDIMQRAFSHNSFQQNGHRRTIAGAPANPRVEGALRPPLDPWGEIDVILRREIIPDKLGSAKPGGRALMVIAQPGAGKTTTAGRIGKILGLDGAGTIDADEFYAYLPGFDSFARRAEGVAYPEAQPPIHYWSGECLQYALKGGLNHILPYSPFGPPIEKQIAALKEACFQVDVAFIAVSPLISRQAIMDRYIGEHKQNRGYGRWVDVELHDGLANCMERMANDIEAQRLADRIFVCDRQGNLLHVKSRETGMRNVSGWSSPEAASKYIHDEQNRSWSSQEQERFRMTHSRILAYASDFGLRYVSEVERDTALRARSQLNAPHSAAVGMETTQAAHSRVGAPNSASTYERRVGHQSHNSSVYAPRATPALSR